MSKNSYFLVKITNEKWADKLLDGEIFMQSLARFGDLLKRDESANNTFRGDSLEGLCISFGDNHNPYTYIQKGTEIEEIVPKQKGLIDVRLLREKIFCLYSLEYHNDNNSFLKPDSRLIDFGNTAIIILDGKEFLKRVCYAMLDRYKNDFWVSAKRVLYEIDFEKNEYYNEFNKDKSYSWQNEFRIALDLSEGRFDKETLDNVTDFAKITFPGKLEEDKNPDSIADSLVIKIGDIRDICIKIPIDKFMDSKYINDIIEDKFVPPPEIPSLIIPRKPYPTFFKLICESPE